MENNSANASNWLGDNNTAAFLTDKGYLMLERRKGGIDYTLAGEDYLSKEAGFLPQPKADLEKIAVEITMKRNINIIGREDYEQVLINYVMANY